MKKVLGILAVSSALGGFSACGGDDSANAVGEAAGVAAAQLEGELAASGYTLDVDCAIKKLVTLSVKDLTAMVEPMVDGEDQGLSEKANAVTEAISTDCVASGEDATEETSEEMTEETTP